MHTLHAFRTFTSAVVMTTNNRTNAIDALSDPSSIELLDNVELRFALADTDAQLEKTLNTFLCPVLLKLASPTEAVRSKVDSRLVHFAAINKAHFSALNIKDE